MNFPSEKELKKIRKELENVEGSWDLEPNASAVDQLKYSICQKFVKYHLETGISQKEMAILIGIDEALLSKMLRYRIESFSLERLLRFLEIIHPNYKLELVN